MFAFDPWFWAFAATLGWLLGFALIGSKRFGNPVTGAISFILAQAPRAILALPFVEQPRLPTSLWTLGAGIAILAVTLPFTGAAFRIVPWSAPTAANPLRTDGFYAIVRHPLMFRDSFWPLGWSLIFGSVIGIALTPIWVAICWVLTVFEEEKLIEAYGRQYVEYRQTTPRLIPFLRI